MIRASNAFLVLSLVASLIAAGAFAGYAKTLHAMTAAGAQTIVICGENGQAEAITLDRNGDPVDAPAVSCAQCSDCTLLSVVAASEPRVVPLPAGVSPASGLVFRAIPVLTHPIQYPSRGPPIQKVV